MEPGFILQILMVILGGVLFFVTTTSLAVKRINEPFSLVWGVVSLVLVAAGVLLRPAGWNRYISQIGLVLALLVVCTMLFAAFFFSCIVSTLMRKTNEMAMQISLLKQENEEMKKALEKVNGNEEDTVCN
ncbi:MAG: DUF2304 domain-containing protein [Acetatifactor sp.]|nr:DUF2304 domain-containing protein [Acetatifactor sp.]